MASPGTWARYIFTKFKSTLTHSFKGYGSGQITEKELIERFKTLWRSKLTFIDVYKGEEMAPTFSSQGETLLIRTLPKPSPRSVFVGDVVTLKDPNDSTKVLVRRVAALEDEEMVSTDEDDESFRILPGHCWVLCDNEALGPKVPEAPDSRTFGPLPLTNIVGRAIYCSRSAVDHGFVRNSDEAMQEDSAVLAVELDVDEMTKQG
eukprot:TRINITY_DN17104_c0_g1_i1.p1 TRINITY_DN17104_c0_g1~~TRINITY_DN17104_c0_g1_i1.p1  ORF type:complete len:205 (+),score=34.91 TRINITY_DN17104_c0_g1_i1:44-658(+)